MTAKRVAAKWGREKLVNLFTDTREESRGLYRFLIESVATLHGAAGRIGALLELVAAIPTERGQGRVDAIAAVQAQAAIDLPELTWIADGRDLWTLFSDEQFIGNTRIDICSRVLKRDLGRKWVESKFGPDDCLLYFGIDNSERERFYGKGEKQGIRNRWLPYTAEAPLCDDLYLSKCEMLNEAYRDGIEPPEDYEKGLPHANCSGACVKGGLAHWNLLLKVDSDLFDYHASEEQKFRERTGKNVAILRDRRGGKSVPLPLVEFRRQVDSGERKVSERDWGKSCQCYYPDDAAPIDVDELLYAEELPVEIAV